MAYLHNQPQALSAAQRRTRETRQRLRNEYAPADRASIALEAIFIDSHSTALAELPRSRRIPAAVLECLRKNPRVSVFDMEAYPWLQGCIDILTQAGRIVAQPSQYPWLRYSIVEGA